MHGVGDLGGHGLHVGRHRCPLCSLLSLPKPLKFPQVLQLDLGHPALIYLCSAHPLSTSSEWRGQVAVALGVGIRGLPCPDPCETWSPPRGLVLRPGCRKTPPCGLNRTTLAASA